MLVVAPAQPLPLSGVTSEFKDDVTGTVWSRKTYKRALGLCGIYSSLIGADYSDKASYSFRCHPETLGN